MSGELTPIPPPRPIRPLFRALAWIFGPIFAAAGVASLGFGGYAALQGEWKVMWVSFPLVLAGWGVAARLLPAAWTGLDQMETEDVFDEE